jgi:hypothetical protein
VTDIEKPSMITAQQAAVLRYLREWEGQVSKRRLLGPHSSPDTWVFSADLESVITSGLAEYDGADSYVQITPAGLAALAEHERSNGK